MITSKRLGRHYELADILSEKLAIPKESRPPDHYDVIGRLALEHFTIDRELAMFREGWKMAGAEKMAESLAEYTKDMRNNE